MGAHDQSRSKNCSNTECKSNLFQEREQKSRSVKKKCNLKDVGMSESWSHFSDKIEGIVVRANDDSSLHLLVAATERVAAAVRQYSLELEEVCEMTPEKIARADIVGAHIGPGRVAVAVRRISGGLAPFVEILATLLHELAYFQHQRPGVAFYRF